MSPGKRKQIDPLEPKSFFLRNGRRGSSPGGIPASASTKEMGTRSRPHSGNLHPCKISLSPENQIDNLGVRYKKIYDQGDLYQICLGTSGSRTSIKSVMFSLEISQIHSTKISPYS